MKRLIRIVVFLNIIILVGCNKNQSDQLLETKVDNTIKVAIANWIEAQKNNLVGSNELDSLAKSFDWNTASIHYKNNEHAFVYVPIESANKNLGLNVFYNVVNRKVDSVDIILITNLSENSKVAKNSDLIFDHYEKRGSRFSGLLTIYSIHNKFKYSVGYSHGVYQFLSKILKLSKNNSLNGKVSTNSTIKTNEAEDCIAWYWITTYPDASTSWIYMYTQCGLCEPNSVIDIPTGQQKIKTNCGGGGGGTSSQYIMNTELIVFEYEYRSRMSTSELYIYDHELTGSQRIIYLTNAYTATKRAESYFAESVYNGQGDAFRHTLFIALNAPSLGVDLTRRLSEAHEENPADPLEKEMDLRNNAKAISIYNWFNSEGLSTTSGFYTTALMIKLLDEISTGGLWIISPRAAGGGVIAGVSQLVHSNE